MIVLGIDPGTVITGYGVIASHNGEITPVDFGAISLPHDADIARRLNLLFESLMQIIQKHRPGAMAIEQPFISKNVKSAMAIGRAQAIAILAAARNNVPVYEYTPARVKQCVANYGASGKEQVQEMVRLQLGLADVPRPADAADALALAICHIQETHLSELISGHGER